jgi:hypothetical protein
VEILKPTEIRRVINKRWVLILEMSLRAEAGITSVGLESALWPGRVIDTPDIEKVLIGGICRVRT